MEVCYASGLTSAGTGFLSGRTLPGKQQQDSFQALGPHPDQNVLRQYPSVTKRIILSGEGHRLCSSLPRQTAPLAGKCGKFFYEQARSRYHRISALAKEEVAGPESNAAVEEASDENGASDEYVEIGVVVGTHGIKGEVVIRSLTDFPKKRFGTPGVRWFRRPGRRQQALIEVELLKGRRGPSRKGKDDSILLKFKGIDTPEDAATYQGCSLLALADDRPQLQEDEFYTRDLVGVEVVLKETGEIVGIVDDVYSVGARDLLKVRRTDLKAADSGKVFHSWVPFVEEIVPVVDMASRRIQLTPPKGLLDLNIKLGPSPAEERREKLLAQIRRKRVIGKMRKQFTREGQEHLFAGLYEGGEQEREALLEDLKSLNLQSLRAAITSAQSLSAAAPVKPYPPPPFPKAIWGERGLDPAGSPLEEPTETDQNAEATLRWWQEGLRMVARGEVAAMVLAGGQGTRLGPQAPPAKGMLDIGLPSGKSLFQLQAERLRKVQELAKQSTEGDVSTVPPIPWLIMTSDATDAATRQFFEEKAHFGLDPSQILFVKQGNMPCVSLKSGNPILLDTPWKVARSPDGNGGVFEALHASGGLEWLRNRGVKYVQAYAVDNALVKVADPVFYGYCAERKVDVGIKVVAKKYPEESVGVVCLKEEGGKSIESEPEPAGGQEAGSSSEAVEKELVERIMAATGMSEREARKEMLKMEEEIAAGGLEDEEDFGEDEFWDDEFGEWYEDEFEGDDEYGDADEDFFLDDTEKPDEEEKEASPERGNESASTSGRRYYGVLEYSELPKELIHARDPPSTTDGVNTPGELQFRAAHICVNMFSTEFLSRLGGGDDLSLPFHLAKKKIKHVVKEGAGWREVEPYAPNGIKLERFIFDAFKFCPEEKVAVLEVERGEEFAPIKNASGEGVPDSPATARDMVLAYHKRLLSAVGLESDGVEEEAKEGKESKKDKKGKKEKEKEGKGKEKKEKGKEKKEKKKKKDGAPEKESESSEPDVIAHGEIPPLVSYAGEGLGEVAALS